MRTDWAHLEQFRVREGTMRSEPGPCAGAFVLRRVRTDFSIIATDGAETGWEHVSVSAKDYKGVRCPTWEEMSWVKGLFWGPEECVVQYHPPRSVYVNCHPAVLHLWRPAFSEVPLPPWWLVGPRT